VKIYNSNTFTLARKHHTALICREGKVYTCGYNQCGELGTGDYIGRDQLTHVPLPDKARIVTTGYHFTIVLLIDGGVYAFGSNFNGQLGHNEQCSDSVRPSKIPYLQNIKHISSGSNFTLALDQNGFTWAFGCNLRGQLGVGDLESRPAPVRVSDIQNITAIATGAAHSIVLDYKGNAWTFGDCNHGRLGQGKQHKPIPIPTKLEFSSAIISIAAGDEHTLLVDCNHHAYSFGNGTFGQLGHGNQHRQFVPNRVALDNIVQVLAAGPRSFFIDIDRRIWACGADYQGQTGLGGNSTFSPMLISEEFHIERFVCLGYEHTIFADSEGNLYGLGDASYGKLSHGHSASFRVPKLIEGVLVEPSKVSLVKSARNTPNCEIKELTYTHAPEIFLEHREEPISKPDNVEVKVSQRIAQKSTSTSSAPRKRECGILFNFFN
jgi:alpha-tubulin suppressor-like RCC1 family protein